MNKTWEIIYNGTERSYMHENLLNNTFYEYRVTALFNFQDGLINITSTEESVITLSGMLMFWNFYFYILIFFPYRI